MDREGEIKGKKVETSNKHVFFLRASSRSKIDTEWQQKQGHL